MSDAELDDVEAALGRKLPAAYRRFIRTYSAEEGRRCGVYLYNHPKVMAAANRHMGTRPDDHAVREPDGAGGWRAERPWPADWIVIGDGDTEWYTFLRPDDRGVWEWQHDSRQVERVAGSLNALMTAGRKRARPAPEPAEPIRSVHPTPGELAWHPDRRCWKGNVEAPSGETVRLHVAPPRDDAESFLATAAELVPPALAAERQVFAAALADGAWDHYVTFDAHPSNGLAGVTADTFRDRLAWWGLSVEHESDGPRLTYHYSYEPLGRPSLYDLELIVCANAADHELRYYHWLL